MTTDQQFDELKQIVLEFPESKIRFDSAVEVKGSPHQHLFTCWGIIADELNGVWLLDSTSTWHELRPSQSNAHLVISSLLQRVKLIKVEMEKGAVKPAAQS